jgi:FKBP-type peptidyl-prolyl cis-trans isomerase FkpA
MKPWIWSITACILLAWMACREKETPEELLAAQQQEITQYASAQGLDGQFTTQGLYYEIVAGQDSAAAKPSNSDEVRVAYEGSFLNGQVFARVDSQDQFSIQISQTIEGWRIGLPLMNEGASIIMILPSELAYGNNGNGTIPPNTILRYDLTLLEILE